MNILEIYNEINLKTLTEFIDNSQEENLNLDFKLVKNASLKSEDDKKNLGRAVSGFANSSGGIIIWGVNARPNSIGTDCAVGLVNIEPLSMFIARLNSLTGDAVSPIVEGVLHKSIKTNEDRGFAVTLIPESDSGPHMAKLGEDRYYKRSGDSFYRMEHYDLEDMFGRRKKPKLELSARIVPGGRQTSDNKTTFEIKIIIAITNVGRGAAKSPFLSIERLSKHQPTRFGIDGNGRFGLEPLVSDSSSNLSIYGGSSDAIIYPGTTRDVTVYKNSIHEDVVDVDDIHFRYRIADEDIQMTVGERVISGVDQIGFVKSLKKK
jgi:hypothetical protein